MARIMLFTVLGVLSRVSMLLMGFVNMVVAALIVLSLYNMLDYIFFPFMRDAQAMLFDRKVLVAYYGLEQTLYTLLMG